MNKKNLWMAAGFLLALISLGRTRAQSLSREYYQIRIYHCKSPGQQNQLSRYLQGSFLPAMNQLGIRPIGVFEEAQPQDTGDFPLYVLIPYMSLHQWETSPERLQALPFFKAHAGSYWEAPADDPAFRRMESILLKAFPDAPRIRVPNLKDPKSQRIYELRSYESPTEKFALNKIHMFNQGGEVNLFKRLGFHAVFYARVLSGSHMPNLMYMTTFENMDARQAHWKAFGADPVWKKLSSMPKYQNNVSRAVILFLRPLDYSQL